MKKQTFQLCIVALSLWIGIDVRAQEAAEGYITTPDNVKIFYKIEGKGTDTLVVVHGGPGNSLESVRPDFVPLTKNRRVIYYDQRGQGRSELVRDPKKLGYENSVADLEALRAYFKLDKMKLIGNSWGGLLASLYAVEHPDRIDRMILDSSAPPIRGFLADMDDEISRRSEKIYTAEQLAHYKPLNDPNLWLKTKDPMAVCNEFYHAVLRAYTYTQTLEGNFKGDVCAGGVDSVRLQPTTRMYMWKSLGEYDLMSKLGVVKAPVLVIHGAADVIPMKSSRFWAYGYPDARLFVIEKAGHISQVEAPDVFFPAIETFLKGEFPAAAVKVEKP